MLKSLTLNNFQSHRDTTLEFDKGVNVIIGSSRSGKTAILRGLIWNRYNKPVGISLNSYWNRDKKKKPVDMYYSTVIFDNGVMTRVRDAVWNGYKGKQNETYEAIGQDVPEQIESLWNMSDVNIQKQFDRPFLLDEGEAEVARVFNRTIKLDKIDQVLSSAEKKRLAYNKKSRDLAAELETLNKDNESLQWIYAIEPMIGRAERIEARSKSREQEMWALGTMLETIYEVENILQLLPKNLDEVLKKMSNAEEFDRKIEEKSEKEGILNDLVINIQTNEELISSVPDTKLLVKQMDAAEILDRKIESDIDKETALKELISNINQQGKLVKAFSVSFGMAMKLMEDAEDFEKEWFDKCDKVSNLENIINNIKSAEDQIKTQVRAITVYESQMPMTCPACGKPLEGDDCEARSV